MIPADKPRFDLSTPSHEEYEQLEAGLDDEERQVLLDSGTEPAFCGLLLEEARDGFYCCRLCGLPLFAAEAKFDSGTGWPSFILPFNDDHILELRDGRDGMIRTEVICGRCGAHQGHVVPDGPPPTGLRYCINSVSLEFIPAGEPLPDKLGRGAPEGVAPGS